MAELQIAAKHWKNAVEGAAMDKHPFLFVIHFAEDEMLGSVWGQPSDEPGVVLTLSSPFAICSDVTDTFVFLDRPGVVKISHMSIKERLCHVVDYELPYGLDDFGRITFGVARIAWMDEDIRRAVDMVTNHRLKVGGQAGFLEAFTAATKWGELNESG